MKFKKKKIHKTVLHSAVENGNMEIVQLLLSCDKVNVNILSISSHVFFHKISNQFFFSIKFFIKFNSVLTRIYQ